MAVGSEQAGVVKRCERCGAAVEGTAVEGLCPGCLLGGVAEGGGWGEGGLPEVDGYRLIERIGEGGMGEVFLAEQMVPVERLVAVKVVKAAGEAERGAVVERFAQERAALAALEHANVARVLDAGETGDGRPFLVLEFVEGEPVTVYCERRGLGLVARARLFLGVLAAVQHAHQKGVIHRDLKPSNVLACDDGDGEPVAKVIDFGVARLLAPGGSVGKREVAGTAESMSPEQAAGDAVDTRADVFSLGILLDSLTGRGGGDLGADLRDVAAMARSEAVEGRYRAVTEMADDVRAALDGRVLRAAGAGAGRRVRKFVRRNASGLSLATLAVLAGVVGFAQWQSVRHARASEQAAHGMAAEEAAKTQLVSEMVYVIFEDLRLAEEAGPLRQRMREVLSGLRQQREGDLARATPEVEFWLRQVWGAAYRGLGEFEAAERELVRVVELMKGAEDMIGPEMRAWIGIGLGQSLLGQGKYLEAEGAYEGVAGQMMGGGGDPQAEPLDLMLVLTGLAEAKLGLGKRGEAEEVLAAIEDLGLPEGTAQVERLRRLMDGDGEK